MTLLWPLVEALEWLLPLLHNINTDLHKHTLCLFANKHTSSYANEHILCMQMSRHVHRDLTEACQSTNPLKVLTFGM